jgi:hypothetical protein
MATGLTISATSNLQTTQQRLLAAAIIAFEPSAPDPSLVRQVPLPAGHFQAIVATYARLSQSTALVEGVDLAQVEQLVTATLTITPEEHGTLVSISKLLARRQFDSDVVSTAGEQMGVSMRNREANDIIALYDGFSKSIVGANNAIDITHFRGAVAFLITDNDTSFGPAPMPVHAAFHAEQISDIVNDLSNPGTVQERTRAGAVANDLLVRWWMGTDRVYGVPIFHSGYITRDSNSDAKGAIFHENALREVEEGEAEVTTEDDNSLRVVEHGIFKVWGEGERADAHGVEVLSDAASTV